MSKFALATAAAAGLVVTSSAFAVPTTDFNPLSAGTLEYNLGSGNGPGDSLVTGPTVVYSSLDDPDDIAEPAPDRAFSSTDLSATYGDSVLLEDTGRLEEFAFSVFNSATGNTGSLATADITIRFFNTDEFVAGDETTGLLGAFTGSLDFTDPNDPADMGLAPGFFTTLTFTGLSGLGTPIDLLDTDVVFTQQLSNVTGGTTRTGVVDFNSTPVGVAADSVYLEASTVNGGTPGFYNVGPAGATTPFFLGGEIVVTAVPEPTSLALLGLGGVTLLRRRSR